MTEERLPTHIWVDAHLRRCSVAAVPTVVIHKGEKMGGTVMLKVYQAGIGCRLLSQMRDLDGKLSWYPAHKEDIIEEREADEHIRRAVDRDPDLWVIEMETRDGTIPLDDD
ncbi:MAG: DUF1491 family protein [Rhodospirillaceae bacterium]|jgi:hypothetical protein|nr:DUF1491 family protein [Rhodospirillaceae bacterium]MBT5459539.1 DUF1491 family protein [Rhodospirillaceae bacterium]